MRKLPYKRLWCSECNEYELFDVKKLFEKELYCDTCGSLYTETKLSEIPEEKSELQRKRYRNKRARSLGEYMAMVGGNGLQFLMNEDYNSEIIEDDAGQRNIDIRNKIKRDEEYEKKRIERESELKEREKYRKLGRNETCLCGSDKKYKKCCWTRITKII